MNCANGNFQLFRAKLERKTVRPVRLFSHSKRTLSFVLENGSRFIQVCLIFVLACYALIANTVNTSELILEDTITFLSKNFARICTF